MLERHQCADQIDACYQATPIVAILGPRQCGKSTLAQAYASSKQAETKVHYFDLEDPTDVALLQSAKLALEELSGLIIIDEIQLRPDLFPLLRVLIDKNKDKQRYLILGSASRDLIQQSSETLAGRISYIELTPFSYLETKAIKALWLRGGFPRSYLAETLEDSILWRKAYVSTFLERDIPNLGFNIAAPTLKRFWSMLAHYHSNIFNASEIGRSLGKSDTTIRHYLDILTGAFMIRQLHPWHVNIKKRQVKSPKIYFRDTGILHTLLGLTDRRSVEHHPKLGASWEGFAIEEIIRANHIDADACYFWATHSGAELDLLLMKNGKKIGFEFKYTDSPKLTKSMSIAFADLELDQLTLIMPGNADFPLTENIRAIGLEKYLQGKAELND